MMVIWWLFERVLVDSGNDGTVLFVHCGGYLMVK